MTTQSKRGLAAVLAGLVTLGASPYTTHAASDRQLIVAWNERGGRSSFIGAIDADQPWSVLTEPLEVGWNSSLRFAFGRLYAISPEERAVRAIDPLRWSLDRTYPLDTSGGILDIAVVSPTTAYITESASARLLRLDLQTGQSHEVLDLRMLSGGKTVPELGTLVAHDGRLLVQVRTLDREEHGSPSYLAVVDLATQQLIDVDPVRDGLQAIELAGTAPKGKMQLRPDDRRLWVNASGGFFDAGGIEAVNLDTLQSEGLAIRESEGLTGADLNAFVMVNAESGYLTYSTDLLASSHLHHFHTRGEVDPTELHVVVDYITPAIEFDPDTNWLFLPSGGFDDSGIHVLDAVTGRRLTDSAVSTGGAPTDLVLIPEPGGLLALFGSIGLTFRRPRRTRV